MNFSSLVLLVNYMLHSAARRPKGLGWRYQAHRRGLEMGSIKLEMCSINLTTTYFSSLVYRLFAPQGE